MRRLDLALLLVAGAVTIAGAQDGTHDLVITHATLFESRQRTVVRDRTVIVDGDRIVAIVRSAGSAPRARVTLDARGRLLTPGFVDAHGHSAYVLGDSITSGGGFVTRLSASADSIARYRRRYASAYLPFGVTAVRDVGSGEVDLPMLMAWSRTAPDLPDLFPCGGALVTADATRVPFQGHAIVEDSAAAVRKVRDYHALGIRHIKLYWRLREPELSAALHEARRLGMTVTGHVDFGVVPFPRAFDLGLRSFEHAYTLGIGVMSPEEFGRVWNVAVPAAYGDRQKARFYLAAMEYFNHLGPDDPRMIRLIDRLAGAGATVVPTLHIFAQRFGLTRFTTPAHGDFDDSSGLTSPQLARARAGYRILAGYVKRMHDAGVPLAIGSDWADPGRACLSEMQLFHDAGIPVRDVLAIATLGTARAIGVDDAHGTIEAGRRANLVLWERSPLEDAKHLWAARTVIKNGVVVQRSAE